MHKQSHSITRLACHLENEQPVYFQSGEEEEALEKAQLNESTLTAWFDLNKEDLNAHKYYYYEIVNHYTFFKKKWKLRKNISEDTIGRMYLVNPNEGERYYLRLLLLNVKAAKSYLELRSHNGIQYRTFKEAAVSRGLLKDDSHFDQCLSEASLTKMPNQLRTMFAIMCVFNQPQDPRALFEKYKFDLCEDYLPRGHVTITPQSIGDAINLCMNDLEDFFNSIIKHIICTIYQNPFQLLNLIQIIKSMTQNLKRELEMK